MSNNEISKQKVKTSAHETVRIDSELYKIGAIATVSFAGGIGIWAFACLASALLSEGPLSLLINLVGAISGTM